MLLGITFAVVGFIASLVGQTALNWLVLKYPIFTDWICGCILIIRFNKKSYIVWCVVSIIAASALLLSVTGTQA